MSTLSTHVLDTSEGKPAKGITTYLEKESNGGWIAFGNGKTDDDGRIKNIAGDNKISPGIYRLTFDTQSYFTTKKQKCFYPKVVIEFEISDESHYHVPLLISGFGYSTYRGS
jgi:5-hydroxyisourate hydrolase